MAREDRFRVPLDAEMIQVLASDTRRDLLRLLRKRRMTLSELSREVDLKKPTVLEHLRRLTDADLVVRDEEDDRLWVYYELTRQGQQILSPDRTRLYLAIGSIAVAAAVAVVALVVAQTLIAPGGSSAPDVAFDVGGDGAVADPVTDEAAGDEAVEAPDRFVTLGPGTDEVTWWQGLDGPLRIRLGEPADGGTLALRPAGGTRTALTAPVEGDRAIVAPTSLDDLPAGAYDLRYRSDDAAEWVPLSAHLTLGSAQVHVVAPGLVAGQPGQVQVASNPPGAIDRATIQLVGATETTDEADAVRTLRVEAAAPDTLPLTIGRRPAHPVPVAAHLATNLTVAGDTIDLEVTGADGRPVADVAVHVDGRAQAFTDEQGRVSIDRPAAGGHELALSTTDGHRVAWPIQVADAGVSRAPPPSVRIVPTKLGPDGATVDVDVGPEDPPSRDATIVVAVDGATVLATRREIPAGGTTVPVGLEALPAAVSVRVRPQTMPPLRVDGTLQQARASTASVNLSNPVTVEALDADLLSGGEARLEVTTHNPSGTPASRRLTVSVEGEPRTQLTVDHAPGETLTHRVRVELGPGDQEIAVDDQRIHVVGGPADSRSEPTVPGPGLLAVAAAGLAAALRRRRR